ncbi:MAG: exodeoxyribonuclease V subunit alpha [Acidimicrobiales bacterium]
MSVLPGPDPFATGLARRAGGLLRVFNEAAVLSAADVHVALRLGALGGTVDEGVLLGVALAVRCPRLGHVCVDLTTIRSTVSTDAEESVDLDALPWPDEEDWVERIRASPLVGDDHPLRLEGNRLYLDRYWSAECQVANDLLSRADRPVDGVDLGVLRSGLDALFGADEHPDLQRLAAATAVLRAVSVIAGGPGTGKTTAIARVLVLLDEQMSLNGQRPPLVALCAPTGKAAVRLEEAVRQEAERLPISPQQRSRLLGLRGQTLHRLLGWSPNHTRFRHHRLNRLAHDVVVVDETSMVSLSNMARLVEAVRPDGRLILVGDPEQLSSVEAGAVLGDLVGPAARGLLMRQAARTALAQVTGHDVPAAEPPTDTPIGDGIVVLRRVHRFGGAIAELAEAIRLGDADATLGLLTAGRDDVRWLAVDVAANPELLDDVRRTAVAAGRRIFHAARDGRADEALAALGSFRLLCAHRRGPEGALTWMSSVESWLESEVEGLGAEGTWYIGRPLLVTANDYSLRLYNGDTGVVIAGGEGRAVAAFERGLEVVTVSPSRLESIDTVYAMTVHKAQGSQFDTVAVLLPGSGSRMLTRELLYTAVTRGRLQVIVAGTEDAIRTALARPIARSSGLRGRLWDAHPAPASPF